MLNRTILVTAVLAATAMAAPIDFTTGIITGTYIFHSNALQFKDGAEITKFPIWDFLADSRPYGAQLVQTGSTGGNESFAAVSGMRQLGFASAVSTGKGALEVGAENGLRFPGAHLAFSRYYTTIKNNTDQEVGFDFPFVIEPGELTLLGVRDGDTAHLRVGGFIDYRLLSPSGPFGGTYDESTGRVFNYFAEIGFDDSPDAANLSMVLLVKQPTELSFATAGYSGHVSLPTIPAFGELTVYYDMYAHMNVLDSEVGGKVRLGDPTDLVGGAGAGFIQRQAVSDTPEPGTLVLFAAGVAGMLALRPRTRTRAA